MDLKNNLLLTIYTVIIGIIAGAIIWCFMRGMNFGIHFLWDYIPRLINFKYYTIIVCIIGGLLIGLWKNKYGDSPEELNEVIKTVKKDHRYSYNNIFSSTVSAILPLILGASVGPEAGLTGIIAGLFTWIGDKLTIFNDELEELAHIGITATLGTIFASPMFGFVEPIENEESSLPKTSKNILYFVAILSSFGIFVFLNHLTHNHAGLHSIGTATLDNLNYPGIILMILLGTVLSYVYFLSHKMSETLFKNLKDNFILKGVIGGLILGVIGTLLPLTMFSGEEQIYILMETGAQLGVIILILTSIIKIVLTNICIETGLKGGHFFPLIFSGTAMGYAMSIILNMDPVISMAIVTTSFMAGILRKPLAVVLLLMIIFPMNLIPLMLVSAIIPCLIDTPEFLEIN
ncbi:MAG: chloride channel protein [Methanobrevibacter sp.]|uniref:chloride channel protein n=1 Tax=Methanobrevibacter sp. TaxID=66852 RepID=UPI0025EEE5AD|nr:chloride channel protein [Methanobrevibacter sp.]MBR0271388.1 chloride channel protein [Methanobrevibacter sp.]